MFISYIEASIAEDLAYIVSKYVIIIYRMPREWITNRDKLFTSKFWQLLMALLGAKHKLLTSYHLQTDGITERINQKLEIYLWSYVDYKQDN